MGKGENEEDGVIDMEDEEKPEQDVKLPEKLPKLLARAAEKPIKYECQWVRNGPKEFHSIDTLVKCYGDRIVKAVNNCDEAAKVQFVPVEVLNESKGKYLVRWEGYPSEFETWEKAKEQWDEEDETGERKKRLIENWKESK